MFDQEDKWLSVALQRKKFRSNRIFNWIDKKIRIPFSQSGRRDNFFRKHVEGNRVLDIGCGAGRPSLLSKGRIVVGIDLVPELLFEADKIYDFTYVMDILDLKSFSAETFDTVVSSDVIGHLPEGSKNTIFKLISDVTKIGGKSVHFIEVEDNSFWGDLAKEYPLLYKKYLIDAPGHISMELPYLVMARFNFAGFQVDKVEYISSFIQEVGMISSMFDNEYKDKFKWLRPLVWIDKILSKNIFIKEICNILLKPIILMELACSIRRNGTSGILISCTKVSSGPIDGN